MPEEDNKIALVKLPNPAQEVRCLARSLHKVEIRVPVLEEVEIYHRVQPAEEYPMGGAETQVEEVEIA